MSTHHKIFKVVLITGTMALLTAISQWNEHYRMNKLERALIHLQENDMVQDSVLLQIQANDRVDSIVGIYEHSKIR
jgi:hypothetical protein